MVLLNSAKRSRNAAQIVNQNQGGGPKKAGTPYQVGRTWWSSIHIGDAPMTNGKYRKGLLKKKKKKQLLKKLWKNLIYRRIHQC